MVSHTGSASALRTAGRLNEPRPALVEPEAGRGAAFVNRLAVELIREEWRVLDRWWTEQPINRRYFDVVLESGQNVVVFHDDDTLPLVQPARRVAE